MNKKTLVVLSFFFITQACSVKLEEQKAEVICKCHSDFKEKFKISEAPKKQLEELDACIDSNSKIKEKEEKMTKKEKDIYDLKVLVEIEKKCPNN